MIKRRVRFAPTLAVSFGLLVALAACSAIWLQWHSNRSIIAELGGRLVSARLDTTETWLHQQLDPVQRQVEQLAASLLSGDRFNDWDFLQGALRDGLQSLPLCGSVLWIDDGGQVLESSRTVLTAGYRDGGSPAHQALRQARLRHRGYWGQPYHHPQRHRTYLNYRVPVRRGGRLLGLVAAAVDLEILSRHLASQSSVLGDTPFVLFGTNRVLAHPRLAGGGMAALDGFVDPVIARLDQAVVSTVVPVGLRRGDRLLRLEPKAGSRGRVDVIAMRDASGFGMNLFKIGVHTPRTRVDASLQTLWLAGVAGGLLLLCTMALALLLSRLVSAPVRRITASVRAISRLELDAITHLGPSRIREVDELASGFNLALSTLRQVQSYLPDRLVERLIKPPAIPLDQPRRGAATVMFTDMVGFSSIASRLDPKELAGLLNRLLGLQAESIEAQGGVVDKFIGDAVMAFWEHTQEDAEVQRAACDCALRIVELIAEAFPAAAGGMVRLRIGIHSGPAVLGSIGAPARRNYTLVGDTVNIACRLEQLGRTVDPGRGCVVLVSEPVVRGAGLGDRGEWLGPVRLKGQREPLRVMKLLPRKGGSRYAAG